MHFRFFAPLVAVVLVGTTFVATAPASDVVVARAGVDIANSAIARRQSPTLQGIIATLTATIDPLLTDLNNQITTTGTIDVTAVTNDLDTISSDLDDLKTELEGFAENPGSLGTTDITTLLNEFLPFVTDLLTTLNSVQTVANATPGLGSTVSPLVSTIIGTLSSDSNLLLGLAPGIFTGLLSTVTGLVPMLTSLDLSSLLAIFGL